MVTSVLSLLLTTNTFGAGLYEHCNSLLSHGVTDITKNTSAEHTLAYKWHSNCGQDFNSFSDKSIRKASVEVFGYGSGSYSGNRAKQQQRLVSWCVKNENFASSKLELFEEAKIINANAIDSWNQCQKISEKGIDINVSVQGDNDEFVDITIDSRSDGSHLFYGLSVVNYSCRIELKDGQIKVLSTDSIEKGRGETLVLTKERPEIDNSNIHISCRRSTPTDTIVDGIGKITYEQGHISVMTSGPGLPITFRKVVENYYVTPPGAVIAFDSSSCPPGWDKYKKAFGRFIRGIDDSESPIDPDGKRSFGHIQEDSVQQHKHSDLGSKIVDMRYYGHSGGHKITRPSGTSTGGVSGARVSGETRPKNVALMYCVKK